MSQSVPEQDPSALTTAQILREAYILRELMEAKHEGAMHVVEEKIQAILKHLELVNDMRVEQKKDMKDALDAALAAQKEAVFQQNTAFALATAKSEMSMSEQMKQINATFGTAIEGVTNTLNDTKDRVSRFESMRQGGDGALNTKRMDTAQLVSILGFALSAVLAIILLTGK